MIDRMNKKIKLSLMIAIIIVIVVAVFNLEIIRDITARQFKTISVINAKVRMQEALEEKYPDCEFRFVNGSYTNAAGEDDDMSYTGEYEVNGQEDNVISVVYSDKDYDDIWKGNIEVSIQTKTYERKCVLAARLAREYTELVKKEMWDELNPYILNQTDISVQSFYQDPDYEAQLPEWLEYGMEFDPTQDLDYEFRFMVQIYQQGEEEKIVQNTINSLNDKKLMFEQYDFMFVSGKEMVHYIYDSSGNLKEQWSEEI